MSFITIVTIIHRPQMYCLNYLKSLTIHSNVLELKGIKYIQKKFSKKSSYDGSVINLFFFLKASNVSKTVYFQDDDLSEGMSEHYY